MGPIAPLTDLALGVKMSLFVHGADQAHSVDKALFCRLNGDKFSSTLR